MIQGPCQLGHIRSRKLRGSREASATTRCWRSNPAQLKGLERNPGYRTAGSQAGPTRRSRYDEVLRSSQTMRMRQPGLWLQGKLKWFDEAWWSTRRHACWSGNHLDGSNRAIPCVNKLRDRARKVDQTHLCDDDITERRSIIILVPLWLLERIVVARCLMRRELCCKIVIAHEAIWTGAARRHEEGRVAASIGIL